MRKQVSVAAIATVCLLSALWQTSAQAQVQGSTWSQPFRLSSDAGRASEGNCVAEQYGYVHCFWTEALFGDDRTIIQYARYDGTVWSTTTDIYVTAAMSGINSVSPIVDQHGRLHLAWSEGLTGPAYYSYAPAGNALSAQDWAPPIRISVPARQLHLRADASDVLHILYINLVEEPGVFHIRSEDKGATWSEPAWLDPDILPNHVPSKLNFELDAAGGLHAVWYYGVLDSTYNPDWVRYAHSHDGGDTWSAPFLLDKYDEESQHKLSSAGPIMAVQGKTVHVIWAAGDLPYRHHRISTDAGRTWSPTKRIFGDLHGQAFDGLAVDSAGRVHFIGQIRFPMGIYHAFWEDGQWSSPALIYLIAVEEGKELSGVIAAHETRPVVRAGNQLVLTLTDNPSHPTRRLYAMQRTLDDVAAIMAVPTPTLAASPSPEPSPTPQEVTPTPVPTETRPFVDAANTQPLEVVPGWDPAIRAAIVPTLLLLAGTVLVRWMFRIKP